MDSAQHYEQYYQEKDMQRDDYLKSIGCRVLRYSNADINYRFREVCEDILNHISETVSYSP